MWILGLKALSSSTTKSVALSTGQRFIQWIALSNLRTTGARSYFLVYQLRCTSCTDQVITEEYSGGNHFIIIADRPPRRQTFSHLLLIRSKSTLLLEERILKLMIRALHDCLHHSSFETNRYLFNRLPPSFFKSSPGLHLPLFACKSNHFQFRSRGPVLLFPRPREQGGENLGNEFSDF